MKLVILRRVLSGTTGIVSIYSTLSCSSQWKVFTNVRMTNMATNDVLNSSRNIVIARQDSMIAWLSLSFTRSISTSLSVPRKICTMNSRWEIYLQYSDWSICSSLTVPERSAQHYSVVVSRCHALAGLSKFFSWMPNTSYPVMSGRETHCEVQVVIFVLFLSSTT